MWLKQVSYEIDGKYARTISRVEFQGKISQNILILYIHENPNTLEGRIEVPSCLNIPKKVPAKIKLYDGRWEYIEVVSRDDILPSYVEIRRSNYLREIILNRYVGFVNPQTIEDLGIEPNKPYIVRLQTITYERMYIL